jgi:hypothetical protein
MNTKMEIDFLTVDRDRDNNDVVIRSSGMIVARMEHDPSYNEETDETLAKGAELLAMAPDLLQQMKNLIEYLGQDWENDPEIKRSVALIKSWDNDWQPDFTEMENKPF